LPGHLSPEKAVCGILKDVPSLKTCLADHDFEACHFFAGKPLRWDLDKV
jgi:hypothetical protein